MKTTLIPMIAVCLASSNSYGQIKDITWNIGPNLPELRKGGCVTVMSGKLISVYGMRFPWGEMATSYVYNPTTDAWSRAPDAPVGQCYVEGTNCGDSFYSIGGRGALTRGKVHPACFRLKVASQGRHQWTRIADLNESRGWAPSASVDGRLYVFGGSKGGHGPCLGSVEMLDTSQSNAKWQTISTLPGKTRGWFGAATVGQKIYLVGGTHFFDPKPTDGDDRVRLNEMLEFDPTKRTWKKKQPLPYETGGLDCCVYQDRYIIVVGGWANRAQFDDELLKLADKQYDSAQRRESYYCPFVQVYDTQTDSWQRMPTLLPFPTHDIRIAADEDTLYVVAGESIEPATSNTTAWLRIGKIVMK